ncbi:RNA 2',3'-cyclic phosphodiesterase [uncultured archaeon]|nr:RNA 2',3'-cyclic phosphodiesterase [uncultured archaeon]
MRLFLAIDLPLELKQKLGKVISGKKITGDTNTHDKMHITLAFLGDKNPEEVLEKLKDFNFKKFEVELKGQCSIPHVNGFAANSPELIPLMAKLHSLFGLQPKDFKPHVTLSRIKSPAEKHDFSESFKFNAERILLLNSIATPRGHVYSIVREFRPVN